MNLSVLQRLGGIAIITGSILLTAWAICWTTLLPIQERARDASVMILNPNWIWIAWLALPALILLIFGFTAVYSRLFRNAGVAGLIGYVLIIIAFLFQAAKVTWEIFLYPVIVGYGPSVALFRERILLQHPQVALFKMLASGVIFFGVILFSLSLMRSKEFTKIAGICILGGSLIYAAGPMLNIYLTILGVVILSLGCLLLGLRLVAQAGQSEEPNF